MLPYNDSDIADEDGLLRYIDPENHVIWDKNIGQRRLSSGAFCETGGVPNGGMSVDNEKVMIIDGFDAIARLDKPLWGIVRLYAGRMRGLGGQVGSDPRKDNPYHAQIWGLHRKKKHVAKVAEWVRKAHGIP